MELKIADNNERELWDLFIKKQNHSPFLQSWSMGEFYRSLEKKIWRFKLEKNGQLVGIALVVKMESRLGSFLYIPAGPVGDWSEGKEVLKKELIKLGKEKGCSFARLDPRVGKEFTFPDTPNAPTFTQPECTLVLDLSKSLDELRSNLSESTRYNIGWVERQGVEVKISQDQKDFQVFQELLTETARRQDFRLYGQTDYYEKQFLAFQKAGEAKLFLAYGPGENEALASAVVIYFGDTVTYLHAASSSLKPKLRAPYLMQWKIIEDAKKGNFHWYDFWGIASSDSPKDTWAGVTAFKKSFGGEKLCYSQAVDLPVSGNYQLIRILEKVRKPFFKLTGL